MVLGTERYNEKTNPNSNIKQNLKQVKDFIKDWIENWKFNAEDNGYLFRGFKTDYKTFANLRIKTDVGTDYFYLKVVKVE